MANQIGSAPLVKSLLNSYVFPRNTPRDVSPAKTAHNIGRTAAGDDWRQSVTRQGKTLAGDVARSGKTGAGNLWLRNIRGTNLSRRGGSISSVSCGRYHGLRNITGNVRAGEDVSNHRALRGSRS